ncbi:MAG: TIGR04283 family arsenosugar biosynthesis glycosyltransferase [Thermodesulfobacteriota bacterium]
MSDKGADPLISIIIPALNEGKYIGRTLERVQQGTGVEVIVVDGGSVDDTIRRSIEAGARLMVIKGGRARQMNAGAQAAQGEILFFLHADTLPPPDFDKAMRVALEEQRVTAGAFRLGIVGKSAGLRLIERLTDWRCRWLGLPYGDQGLFLRADLFREMDGFPDLPIMEDFVMVRRLRRRGRIVTLPLAVATAGRRWQSLGIWRTTLINQMIILGYYMGVDPAVLARCYRGRRGRNAPVKTSSKLWEFIKLKSVPG